MFGGSSGTDGKKVAKFLGGYLSKMGDSDQDKYRSQAEQFGARPLGYPMGGSGGQILHNLGVVFPQQHAPLYTGTVDAGGKSTGQRIAGGLSGALQGFLTGAATGMPHMAAVGAIGGGLSGAMG